MHNTLIDAITTAESALYRPLLEGVHGQRMVIVGGERVDSLLEHGHLPDTYLVTPHWPATDRGNGIHSLQSDGVAIPLTSEAFDAVVLFHALETSDDPHRLLREAERVLRPGGFLVLLGYNPMSFWGLGRCFRRKDAWHSLHLRRLTDWLQLLNLKKLALEYAFYRPHWRSPLALRLLRWLEAAGRWTRLPLGSLYGLLARKDPFGMTPLFEPATGVPVRRPAFLPASRLPHSRGRSG